MKEGVVNAWWCWYLLWRWFKISSDGLPVIIKELNHMMWTLILSSSMTASSAKNGIQSKNMNLFGSPSTAIKILNFLHDKNVRWKLPETKNVSREHSWNLKSLQRKVITYTLLNAPLVKHMRLNNRLITKMIWLVLEYILNRNEQG